LESFVIIVAASLTMLAGRSHRPIIPIVDSRQFMAGREPWPTMPSVIAALSPAPAA
jgi:hypothetical protein